MNVDLEKGEVFGIASASTETGVFEGVPIINTLVKPDGTLAFRSSGFITGIEGVTPLPLSVEDNFFVSVFHYVVPETGTYELTLRGFGDFETELNAKKTGLANKDKQYIYVNMADLQVRLNEIFVQEEVNPGVNINTLRTLSNLRSFMEDFGIDDTDANFEELTQKIMVFVERALDEEIRAANINPNFNVKIVSDFGSETAAEEILEMFDANATEFSKVLVGGIQEEFGANVLGASGDIDIGNYRTDGTAVLLLDRLAGIDEDQDGPNVNEVSVASGKSRIDVTAELIGHKVCHQIGHLLGCFHTENGRVFSIMDSTADTFHLLGLPENGVFGRDEEIPHVPFSKDEFAGVTEGANETDVIVAFALSERPSQASKEEQSKIQRLDKALDNIMARALNTPILDHSKMRSYPVPAKYNGISTVALTPEHSGETTIDLYDMKGVNLGQVYTGDVEAGQALEFTVNLAPFNITPGVYIYKLNPEKGRKQSHVFVVK